MKQGMNSLGKGRRITGSERDMIGAHLRDRYAQGASIRDVMAEPGRGTGSTGSDVCGVTSMSTFRQQRGRGRQNVDKTSTKG